MKKFLAKTFIHICTAGCISLLFFVPGWIFSLFKPVYFQQFSWKYFLIFGLFACILSFLRSTMQCSVIIAFLAILEMTQFGSLAYFGDFINPFTIQQMFIEFADVAEESISSSRTLFYVPLLILLPYATAIGLLLITSRLRYRIRYMWIFAILFLCFPAIRIKTHSNSNDIMKFFPVLSYPTLANTLNSYSAWLTFIVPENFASHPPSTFKPITVSTNGPVPEKITVIVVMGESFTVNHMSAFGYERPTTPRLQQWQEQENLTLLPGYSASIATRTTMPLFFNVQYNPLNAEIAMSQQTNLFNLAKANGFANIYISAQRGNCLNGISTRNIDTLIAYEQQSDIFDKQRDDALLATLQRLPQADRQFVVLHQRNVHAPYHRNYQNCEECKRYPIDGLEHEKMMINSYDNAVIYNDLLWTNILTYAKNLDGEVHVFLTSDHGELFGENGLWGHNHLNLDSVAVPVGYYTNSGNNIIRSKLMTSKRPTHYEVALGIAELLGYSINDPNTEPGVFYANGLAAFGKSGYIQFQRNEHGSIGDVTVVYPE